MASKDEAKAKTPVKKSWIAQKTEELKNGAKAKMSQLKDGLKAKPKATPTGDTKATQTEATKPTQTEATKATQTEASLKTGKANTAKGCPQCAGDKSTLDAKCWATTKNLKGWKSIAATEKSNNVCLCPVDYASTSKHDVTIKRAATSSEQARLKDVQLCKKADEASYDTSDGDCTSDGKVTVQVSAECVGPLTTMNQEILKRCHAGFLQDGFDACFLKAVLPTGAADETPESKCFKFEKFYTGRGTMGVE